MEVVCSLILRLGEAEKAGPGDALSERVSSLVRLGGSRGLTPIDLAVGLVDHVAFRNQSRGHVDEGSESADDLLAEFESSVFSRRRSRFVAEEPTYDAPDEAIVFLAALCREGIKPVAKAELFPEDVALAMIERYDLPNARLRRAVPDECMVEIFFGENPADVERAVEATSRAMAPRNDKEEQESLLEVGLLLGYPNCCVEQWSLFESARMRESYAWLQLARRVEFPGPVDTEMSPWAGLLVNQYVPCRLDCKASLAMLPLFRSVANKVVDRNSRRSGRMRAMNPWLVLLRGQCSALELVPKDQPGDRFRYRAGVTQWGENEAELVAAANADEIVLEPERLLLLKKGRVTSDLSARAFVWWHERALQAEFWSKVVEIRNLSARAVANVQECKANDMGSRQEPADPDGRETDALAASSELEELREELEAFLERALSSRSESKEIDDWKIWVRSKDQLSLRLSSGGERILLYVSDEKPGQRGFFKVGRFLFTIPKEQSLRTPRVRRAITFLARKIGARKCR